MPRWCSTRRRTAPTPGRSTVRGSSARAAAATDVQFDQRHERPDRGQPGHAALPSGLAAGGPLTVASSATLQATGLIARAVTGAGTVTATDDLIIGKSEQSGQFNQGGSPASAAC